jgi:hypothetical protein
MDTAFDRAGHLTHIMGAVRPGQAVGRRPVIDAEQAVASLTRVAHTSHRGFRSTGPIEGRRNRLVWTVELNGRRDPALLAVLGIDANDRTVVARDDHCEHGVISIPVTHYSHPGGIKDSTGTTTTSNIVVDALVTTLPSKVPNLPPGTITSYSLQRLGSGRSRIWNAKPMGVNPMPVFHRTTSGTANYFTKLPGTTTSCIFNEQQTYYWAQTLKTAVDEWGREPNDYGHHPVDAARAINVEIVVNGNVDGTGLEPGHECPARLLPPRYAGLLVLELGRHGPGGLPLFNSDGNSTSPQFFGPEYSGSH